MLRTHTAAAVAALVLVLVLPATGLAMNGPVGGAPGTVIPLPANYLRDAKYSPAPWTVTPVQVGDVVKPGGFDYQDAAVGAVVGVLALTILGGTLLVVRHERDAMHVHAGTGA
jgi:hypothetical protein